MSAKHTPGPWSVEHLEGYITGRILAGDGSLVVGSTSRGGGVVTRDDAHLIAAAPDLLAALHEYLMAGHKEARRTASARAKAAIAKAKGKP